MGHRTLVIGHCTRCPKKVIFSPFLSFDFGRLTRSVQVLSFESLNRNFEIDLGLDLEEGEGRGGILSF